MNGRRSARARSSACARRFPVRSDWMREENMTNCKITGWQDCRKDWRKDCPPFLQSCNSAILQFPRNPSRQDLDPIDDVPFENPLHDIDTVQHLCEHGVLVIESGVVDEIDEDLGVAGVATACRDTDRAPHVRP